MSRSAVVHAAWFTIAAGAFAAGAYLVPRSVTPDSDAAPSPRFVSVPDEGESARTKGSATEPASLRAAGDAASFIEKYRLGGTGGLNEQGMTDAVAEAIRESDPVKSSLMFAMLLEELTPENAAAASEAVRASSSGMDAMRFLSLLSYKWGAIDGAGAVENAQADPDGRASTFGTMLALSGWASADPDAALEWLSSQEDTDGRARGMWMRGLVSGLANSDPAAATALLTEMAASGDEEASNYIGSIVQQQIKLNGIQGAESWANSLSDTSLKTSAFRDIADAYTRQDPAAAADWIARYAGEDFATDAVSRIAGRFADTNPQEAVKWATTLPAGEAQNRATRQAFNQWTDNDPMAASEYLTKMPASASKDHAITGLVGEIARQDPESALAWSLSISDPELQQRNIVENASRWFRRDQEAAANWVAGANLPEATQNAIVEQASEPRGERGGPGGGDFRGRRGGGRF
ncbi:hypothetical protein BH23VER1_BH23VER1_27200 [soil metagenome]